MELMVDCFFPILVLRVKVSKMILDINKLNVNLFNLKTFFCIIFLRMFIVAEDKVQDLC